MPSARRCRRMLPRKFPSSLRPVMPSAYRTCSFHLFDIGGLILICYQCRRLPSRNALGRASRLFTLHFTVLLSSHASRDYFTPRFG